jgi:hypothetical protein
MKRGLALRVFVYFLSISFLLMMNGFPRMVAEAGEGNLPVGNMVSRGEVKFEAKGNVWKKVESSRFEIFKGAAIKTEKGMGIITLLNNNKLKVGPDSLFSIDQEGRFILSRGSFEFCVPNASEMTFKVGNLFISKSQMFQAAKEGSVVSPKSEEGMGTISIHSNGAVTVKSIQGSLSVVNQDRVVVAAIASKDSVTIPSTQVGKAERVMVAQVDTSSSAAATTEEAGNFLGISTWGWVAIAAEVAYAAGIAVTAVVRNRGGSDDTIPICP